MEKGNTLQTTLFAARDEIIGRVQNEMLHLVLFIRKLLLFPHHQHILCIMNNGSSTESTFLFHL
jgi:hypothetical protein